MSSTEAGRPSAGERLRSEAGASLIIVMAFLLIVGVVVGSLFALAISGTRSLRDYKVERAQRYAADGALDYAVNRVARETSLGETDATGCGPWSFAIENRAAGDDVFAPGSAVTVTCAPYVLGGIDLDNGQKVRYVEFTAKCVTFIPRTATAKAQCYSNGSGPERVIGTAKVRYDVSLTAPVSSRARIPKVITWDVEP